MPSFVGHSLFAGKALTWSVSVDFGKVMVVLPVGDMLGETIQIQGLFGFDFCAIIVIHKFV